MLYKEITLALVKEISPGWAGQKEMDPKHSNLRHLLVFFFLCNIFIEYPRASRYITIQDLNYFIRSLFMMRKQGCVIYLMYTHHEHLDYSHLLSITHFEHKLPGKRKETFSLSCLFQNYTGQILYSMGENIPDIGKLLPHSYGGSSTKIRNLCSFFISKAKIMDIDTDFKSTSFEIN